MYGGKAKSQVTGALSEREVLDLVAAEIGICKLILLERSPAQKSSLVITGVKVELKAYVSETCSVSIISVDVGQMPQITCLCMYTGGTKVTTHSLFLQILFLLYKTYCSSRCSRGEGR
jgi:hypothetical protein